MLASGDIGRLLVKLTLVLTLVTGCAAASATGAPIPSLGASPLPMIASPSATTPPVATPMATPLGSTPVPAPSVESSALPSATASSAPIPDGVYVTAIVTRAMAEAVFKTFYKGDATKVSQAMSNFGTTEQYQLKLSDGRLEQSGAKDGENLGIGATAQYAFPDDHTIVLQENEVACVDTFTIVRHGEAFNLTDLRSTCPIDPIGLVIFESSRWTTKETATPIPDGQYVTGLISRKSAETTITKAGVAIDGDAQAFLDEFPQHFEIRLASGQLDILEDVGGTGIFEVGATGTYAFPDEHTLAFQDAAACASLLTLSWKGPSLSIKVVKDSCGVKDMAFLQVIFETTPWTARA